MWISKRKYKETLNEAYNEGLGNGYKLGYLMGQVEARNRLLKPMSKVESEMDDILEEKGM